MPISIDDFDKLDFSTTPKTPKAPARQPKQSAVDFLSADFSPKETSGGGVLPAGTKINYNVPRSDTSGASSLVGKALDAIGLRDFRIATKRGFNEFRSTGNKLGYVIGDLAGLDGFRDANQAEIDRLEAKNKRLAQKYTQGTQDALAAVERVSKDPTTGAADLAGAYISNPSAIAVAVNESLVPSLALPAVGMGAGVGASVAIKAAPALARVVNPYKIAMGLTGLTDAVSNGADAYTETKGDKLHKALAMAATGGVTYLSNKLTGQGAIGDLYKAAFKKGADDSLAQIATKAPLSRALSTARDLTFKSAKGGVHEVLNELPQTAGQDVSVDLASGRDVDTNKLSKDLVTSALTAAVMGGATGGGGRLIEHARAGKVHSAQQAATPEEREARFAAVNQSVDKGLKDLEAEMKRNTVPAQTPATQQGTGVEPEQAAPITQHAEAQPGEYSEADTYTEPEAAEDPEWNGESSGTGAIDEAWRNAGEYPSEVQDPALELEDILPETDPATVPAATPTPTVTAAASTPETTATPITTAAPTAVTATSGTLAATATTPATGKLAGTDIDLSPTEETDTSSLQNRNRDNPNSVTQMRNISSNPDYERTSFSREFANGAPVVSFGTVPAEQRGRVDYVKAADGTRIPVQYAVVESDTIDTSNGIDGSVNPAYPDKNGRIKAIAGNGRITGISYAYRAGRASGYRQRLISDAALTGVNPTVIEGMRSPVLVRLMPGKLVKGNIGDLSNQPGTLSLSAVEQAETDSARVDLGHLHFNEDGSPTIETVEGFVQSMPEAEQQVLIDRNGAPTRQAVDRLNAAVFSKGYEDPELTRLYAQASDPEARLVMSALAQIASKAARLEGTGDLDIRSMISDAAKTAVNAKRQGLSLREAASQIDMDEDPNAYRVLQLFAVNPRSNKRVIEILSRILDRAYEESHRDISPDMLSLSRAGEAPAPRMTREQLAEEISKETENYANQRSGKEDLEQQGGAASVRDVAERRGGDAGRPGDHRAPEANGEEPVSDGQAESEGSGRQEGLKLSIGDRFTDAKQKIQRIVQRVRDGLSTSAHGRDSFEDYLPVSEETAERISKLGFDVRGYVHSLTDASVAHILNRHSERMEEREDQIPLTDSDLSRLPEVVNQPDEILPVGRSGNSGNNVLLFRKAFPDGTSIFAEEIRKGRKKLMLLTAYKKAPAALDARPPKRNPPLKRPKRSASSLPEENIADFSKTRGATVEEVDDSLRSEFGDDLVDGLRDNGVVEIVQSEEDLPGNIQEALKSQINKKTRYVVPDALANGNNSDGRLATVDFKGKNGFPSGAVVVTVGKQGEDAHRGLGAKHLTFHAVTGRTNYRTVVNKTEAGLRDAVDTLKTASYVFRVDDGGKHVTYVFYSSKSRSALVTYYRDGKYFTNGEFVVITERPVKTNPRSLWGSDYISASGAVRIPDSSDSASPAPWSDSSSNEAETRLGAALGERYEQTDYTEEVRNQLITKKSSNGAIQGLYDPKTGKSYLITSNLTRESAPAVLLHEVGIHASADPSMKPVFRRAVQIVKNGQKLKGNDRIQTLCKKVQARLDQAGETSAEEATAYLVEEAKLAGFGYEDRGPIGNFLRQFALAVKTWITKHIGNASGFQLSIDDLVEIARANVKNVAENGSATESPEEVMLSRRGKPNGFFSKDNQDPLAPIGPKWMPTGWKRGARLNKEQRLRSGQLQGIPTERPYIRPTKAHSRESTPEMRMTSDQLPGVMDTGNSLSLDANLRNAAGAAESDAKRRARFAAEDAAAARRAGKDGRAAQVSQLISDLNGAAKRTGKTLGVKARAHFGDIDWRPSKWLDRDQFGARSFALGRDLVTHTADYAYDVLQTAIPPLRTAYSFKPLKADARKMLRQQKAEIARTQRTIGVIGTELQKLPPEDRELISDIIEKTIKPGIIPPKSALELADKISKVMTAQTTELVDLGMLTKESANRWRGRYLPRFYSSKELWMNEDGGKGDMFDYFRNLFRLGNPHQGIAGGSLKARGLFKEIPTESLDDFMRLGWKVRDANYEWRKEAADRQGRLFNKDTGRPVEVPATVTVWRDWTPSERAQMGEIKDASYRFVVGGMQMAKDISLGHLFRGIANNPEWTRTSPSEGWSQVPDTEIPGTGGVKRYGELAGKWVRDDILTSLMATTDTPKGLTKALRGVMAYWKEGKTALNPVSHVNNVVGNLIMCHLGGVPIWNAQSYVRALRDVYHDTDRLHEAMDAGLISGSFTQEEIAQLLPPEFKEVMGKTDSGIKKGADFVWNFMSLGLRGKLREAYGVEDTVFKLALYNYARDKGATPEDAVDHANRFIFAYDDLPRGAKVVRDTAIPFFAWTYKAMTVLPVVAAQYPWRFAMPAVALHTMQAVTYAMAAGADGDSWLEKLEKGQKLKENEEKLKPEYLRGTSAFFTPKAVRLGIDDATGMPRLWNMQNFLPGGNFLDATNQMGGVGVLEPIMPSHPLLNAYMAMIANVDSFSGNPVTLESDTAGEKAYKRAGYLYRLASPALAIGGYHFDRLANAAANATGIPVKTPWGDYTGIGRSGQAFTLSNAMLNTVGIKVRDVDYNKEARMQALKLKSESSEIASKIRSQARAHKAGAVTDETFERFRAEQLEKIRRNAEAMRKISDANKERKRLSGIDE